MLKLHKIFKLGLILLMLFSLSGCRSLLIPQDKPLVLNQSDTFQNSTQNTSEILSFENIAAGTAQDISYDGSTLLLLNTVDTPPITYTINLLKMMDNTNQLTSFVNSDKHQLSAQFSEYAGGVFYVERSGNGSDKPINQLIWTASDKSATKTISSPEENVNANICAVDDSRILYSNANNQIVFASTSGERQVYHTRRNIPILDIQYYEPKNMLLFTGTDPLNNQKTNLYQAVIKEDSNEVTSSQVDENVLNFSLNQQTGELIYTQLMGDTRRIMNYTPSKGTPPTLISEGNFTSAFYTPSGEKILYAQFSNMNTKTSQSIFIMDANGKNKFQLSAPLALTSPIIAHPYKSTLYFSMEKNAEDSKNNISKEPTSLVYKIDYNLK